ncbi:MAG: AAA family ATPase [Pleurocapsa sp. SU_196_0]|nr:AAA family ATPase [Pleurocapsa sp. SU_196_0]
MNVERERLETATGFNVDLSTFTCFSGVRVKLVFIYGLPGTGKLTVARALCALTGWQLFHNHLTVDLAASLFPHGSPEYNEFVRSLRLEAFRRAAAADVNLVFTFWYSSVSQPSVDLYREVIESCGGEVLFVHLHCRADILEARVQSDSRRNWKIWGVDALRSVLEEFGTTDAIAGTPLEIDNSDLEPEEVARRIAAFYGLPTLAH